MISSLFEDWLQSGKCWLKSSLVLNARRTRQEKRKGAHVMRDKTWIQEKYGELSAASIIQSKKDLQAARTKDTDPIWVMRNPDLPDSEEPFLQLNYKLSLKKISKPDCEL